MARRRFAERFPRVASTSSTPREFNASASSRLRLSSSIPVGVHQSRRSRCDGHVQPGTSRLGFLVPGRERLPGVSDIIVIPGQGCEVVRIARRAGLPVGLPVRVGLESRRIAGQESAEDIAHHGMDAEPAGLGVRLHEAVVAQGVPGLVLVDVAGRRERGAGGGLVESRGLREVDDPVLGMLVVERFQEALGELAVVAGSHVERLGPGSMPRFRSASTVSAQRPRVKG